MASLVEVGGVMKREGSQPYSRLLSPGFLCQEEEPLQHLTIKSNENSVHPSDMEDVWKARELLKGLEHGLTHMQTLTWSPVQGRQLERCQRYMEKD